MGSTHTTCIHTVRREVGDTTDGVTLNFHVWTEHLANQWLETAELDDEKFIIR